jgi:hypothetical protein
MLQSTLLSPSGIGCCGTAVIPWILIICSVLSVMFAALYCGLKPEIVGCKKDPFTVWLSPSYVGESEYYSQTMSCSGDFFPNCYCYDLKMKNCLTYEAPDTASDSAQTCSTFLASRQHPVNVCALVVLALSVLVLILTISLKYIVTRQVNK